MCGFLVVVGLVLSDVVIYSENNRFRGINLKHSLVVDHHIDVVLFANGTKRALTCEHTTRCCL